MPPREAGLPTCSLPPTLFLVHTHSAPKWWISPHWFEVVCVSSPRGYALHGLSSLQGEKEPSLSLVSFPLHTLGPNAVGGPPRRCRWGLVSLVSGPPRVWGSRVSARTPRGGWRTTGRKGTWPGGTLQAHTLVLWKEKSRNFKGKDSERNTEF